MIETLASIDWAAVWSAIATLAAAITSLIAVLKDNDVKTVQKFFDPQDTTIMTPPAGTPDRSWKMSDGVKNFIINSQVPEDEKAAVLEQIAAAEKAGLVDYKISFSKGYYDISYGQIAGAATYGR